MEKEKLNELDAYKIAYDFASELYKKFNNLIKYVDVLYFVIIVDMSCYYICGPIFTWMCWNLILSQITIM